MYFYAPYTQGWKVKKISIKTSEREDLKKDWMEFQELKAILYKGTYQWVISRADLTLQNKYKSVILKMLR